VSGEVPRTEIFAEAGVRFLGARAEKAYAAFRFIRKHEAPMRDVCYPVASKLTKLMSEVEILRLAQRASTVSNNHLVDPADQSSLISRVPLALRDLPGCGGQAISQSGDPAAMVDR
jgi:hypothetical protein